VTDSDAALLVVDDNEDNRYTLTRRLKREGYTDVTTANDGGQALALLRSRAFDLVLLDVMMPGMDGLQLLRRLRMEGSVPVLMLTARGDEDDRVLGLELGADDYLSKPFSARELIARVRAVLRRSEIPTSLPARKLEIGSLTIDAEEFSATLNGVPVRLTTAEFMVLEALARCPGHVQSRASLTYQALGRALEPFDRSIDTHVSNIRRKLSMDGGRGIDIKNMRGHGYVLTTPNLLT
jgi:DNA-binding response OmpR family regulator